MSNGKKVIPESDVTIGESMARPKTYGNVKDAQCLACGKSYSLSKILLQDPVAPSAVTLGLCALHQAEVDNGYVHLVAVDQGSPKYPSGQIDPYQVKRLGALVAMTQSMFTKIFLQPPPEHGVVFVNMDVVETIKTLKDDLEVVASVKES